MSLSPDQHAELALLLEVTSTPKPGNVDRHREYGDLRFEHFVTGAVGARPGLDLAADPDVPLGVAFERAIAGMSRQSGGNTQFGAILLTVPLVRAVAESTDPLTSARAATVVDRTTVGDAVAFYRAFEHVDVAVDEPPEGMAAIDVRRGGDAAPTLRERDLTLRDVMALSAPADGVAAEWVDGFQRTFAVAESILDREGSVSDRAARVYLAQLAETVDTFVETTHDRATAVEVRDRAAAALAGEEDVEEFAEELVERGINPGTTADVIAGGLFVALERGLEV